MIPPVAPEVAYVRAVPDAYADCLRPDGVAIDVARARDQHDAYVAALRGVGAEIRWLPAAPTLPDAVFVEDVAVLLPDGATLLTRPGAPSRRAEVASAETQLAARGPVEVLPDDACLDGGDVMRWGSTFFVGLTGRTNAVAVSSFAAIGGRRGFDVVGVEVRSGLHLKSACTVLDAGSVLCLGDRIDVAPLRAAGLEVISAPDDAGSNVLGFGAQVLVSAAAPRTAELVAARGMEVISVEIEQFHRGDGALSCLVSARGAGPGGGACSMAAVATDFELLDKWREGDNEAGSTLLGRYFDNLFRFFASKIDDEVEDLIQGTMLACVKYQASLEGVESFKAYLFTVARNQLYRHLRGRFKRDAVDFGVTSVVQLGVSPTSIIARREQEQRLLTALRTLPVELQLLLELHYWEGLSSSELAQVIGVPHGTAKSRIRRARELLAKALQKPVPPDASDEEGDLDAWVRSIQLLKADGGT